MTDMIEEWRTGDMTATLTHVAGLLESLPLDGYRDALALQLREAAKLDDPGEDEPASSKHRRARRGALLAAVCGARDFITGMHDALAHNRAATRADELEESARVEQAIERPLAPVRPLRPSGSRMHDVFPGLRTVIPLRREEALGGDDEPA